MNTFSGKRVLITGGTSGIGLATADAFRAQGARVAVCARSDQALAQFISSRPDALAIQADITETAAQARLLDAVESAYGGLDILINNAGRMVERDFTAAPPDVSDLAQEIALNLTAPIQLTSAALRRRPTMDAIVFVTSGYALVSPRRAPTYGAAKAGLHGFAEGLRRQFASQGPHVLEVLPPAVDTPATAQTSGRKIPPEAVANALLSGLTTRKPLALVGATQLLPTLLRLAPSAVSRAVSNG